MLQQTIFQLLFAYPSYFKEIATLTAASASGRTTYCSVSIGHSKDIILQAGRLDQAPIIHQVTSAVTLVPFVRIPNCRIGNVGVSLVSDYSKVALLPSAQYKWLFLFAWSESRHINPLPQLCRAFWYGIPYDIKLHENYGYWQLRF